MSSTVVELLVLEGEDAGRLFTLTRNEVLIARIDPARTQPGAILLSDQTVSTRQATIHVDGTEHTIEHHPNATNPTTVNGKPVIRESFAPGDKIGMGRVLFEVRERPETLFGMATRKAKIAEKDTGPRTAVGTPVPNDTTPLESPSARATDVRPVPGPRLKLTLVSGADDMDQASFSIDRRSTRIGRSSQCEVSIPEGGVSRLHAEISIEGEQVKLIHRSSTNSTSVNGRLITDSTALEPGDHIQLADRVVLRYDRIEGLQKQGALWKRMEDELERNRQLEEEFGAFGSFLDIDVVGSYGMKSQATHPGHIVVSFERWRAWVEETLKLHDGEMLNSNGDELMCFFESAQQAVRAASQLLDELDSFNDEHNLLTHPFKLRMGVHTGHSLVDRDRGVAYSEVLDVAGHLQKESPPNSLLISADTLAELGEDAPFEAAGSLQQAGISTYRMTGRMA